MVAVEKQCATMWVTHVCTYARTHARTHTLACVSMAQLAPSNTVNACMGYLSSVFNLPFSHSLVQLQTNGLGVYTTPQVHACMHVSAITLCSVTLSVFHACKTSCVYHSWKSLTCIGDYMVKKETSIFEWFNIYQLTQSKAKYHSATITQVILLPRTNTRENNLTSFIIFCRGNLLSAKL